MGKLKDEALFDVRLMGRHIERGLITQKDVQTRLKSTEDLSDQAEWLSFDDMGKPADSARSNDAEAPVPKTTES